MCVWFMCWAERVTENGDLTTVFHEEGRRETSRPLISLNDSLEVFIFGIKNLVNALLILILAWTVGDSFTKCGTGIYISSALEDSVDSGAYPALTFVISGILALVTGSSWGTMSIMSVLHSLEPLIGALGFHSSSPLLTILTHATRRSFMEPSLRS
jgi:Na+/H+ antiporter NhaC